MSKFFFAVGWTGITRDFPLLTSHPANGVEFDLTACTSSFQFLGDRFGRSTRFPLISFIKDSRDVELTATVTIFVARDATMGRTCVV